MWLHAYLYSAHGVCNAVLMYVTQFLTRMWPSLSWRYILRHFTEQNWLVETTITTHRYSELLSGCCFKAKAKCIVLFVCTTVTVIETSKLWEWLGWHTGISTILVISYLFNPLEPPACACAWSVAYQVYTDWIRIVSVIYFMHHQYFLH